MQLELTAQAKINLTLKIVGKRTDGYHELETVMQAINLSDSLIFYHRDQGFELTVEGFAPTGEDNLVCRAARLIKEYTGVNKGCLIHLKKCIPMAAGLAGGSANAAATLQGLNKLWDLKLTDQELLNIGERLGADVPFCIMGGTALAKGKGEELTPLSSVPEMGVILIKPNFGVSTAEVFKRFADVKTKKRPDTAAMISAVGSQNVVEIAQNLGNDLEYVTLEMHPELKKIKQQLKDAGALGVLMSGSGPTIFGITETYQRARKIVKTLNITDAQVIATSTVEKNQRNNYKTV
ncbi:MAG: 4-(cytidine 5'-diphospho)-2-C-methyl-D-erythritol kinase [Firmicutes bacterium]|nr:4-(cytidine 5'-diphospho)-2-C-methyl-D-erythritol kinase [Bacillota bacterium]